MPVHPALLPLLVCPLDHAPLHIDGNTLVSQSGRIYPVVDDTIPVMIIPGIEQTFDVVTRSRNEADEACLRDGVIDTSIWEGWDKKDTKGLHPFVSKMVGATCGHMYQNMVGHLVEYPIPTLRLPPAAGKSFLELGCNWGRWCIAAHRLGYQAFGLDPVLEAIHAAYSVARQLNADCRYAVGDARHLPFPDATFDVVFSYSVLQHFTRSDVLTTLSEVKRVLKPGGRCLIQMANTYGLRCLYHQARRGFREPTVPFDVRYWTPGKLKKTFTEKIGPTQLFVDGYFNLNPQPSASKLLPWRYRTIVRTSETLRALAKYIKPLTWAADSLYLSSVKKEQ